MSIPYGFCGISGGAIGAIFLEVKQGSLSPDKLLLLINSANLAANSCNGGNLAIISVKKFKGCKKKVAQYEEISVQVVKGTEEETIAMFEQTANALGATCSEQPVEVYAAVPEWWQIRPEGNRPQLVLQFCVDLGNGTFGPPKYSLTVPHPKNTQKPLSAPLPEYKKGSFEGELKLADNSKVIVNCESIGEAKRVIGVMKGLIQNEMVKNATTKFSERGGKKVKEDKMVAMIVTYFENGIQDSSDFKWKVKYALPTK